MKIVIDMQGAQLEKEPRGIARYIICLVREILKKPRGHEIVLLFNGGFSDSVLRIQQYFNGDLKPSQSVVWQPAFPMDKGYQQTPWRIMVDDAIHEAWINKLSPDIFLSPSCFVPPSNGFHMRISDQPRSYSIVYTLHDLIPLAFKELYLDPHPIAAKIFLDQTENFIKADAWLTISDYSAREGVDLLSLDPEKIYNASEGADDFFHSEVVSDQDQQSLRDQYSIQDNFLLYVGGFDPRKNIPLSIKAYGRLTPEIQNRCQFVIAGGLTPSIKKSLESVIMDVGIRKDRIVFTGFIDDKTLRSLYCLSTAFVFPTLAEGFGLPALEAMNCGTAVICSGCSSLLEVVNNPDAYFDPKSIESMSQKMEQVIVDPAFREDLARKGKDQAKRFSWADSAEHALEFLERVGRKSKGVSPTPPDIIQQISQTAYKPTDQELMAVSKALSHQY